MSDLEYTVKDGIAAAEAELQHLPQQPPAEARGVVGRADQRYGLRREESGEMRSSASIGGLVVFEFFLRQLLDG